MQFGQQKYEFILYFQRKLQKKSMKLITRRGWSGVAAELAELALVNQVDQLTNQVDDVTSDQLMTI